MALAREQHEAYVRELRKIVPVVYCLPALPDYPDCSFVEDVVVAVNGRAVMTQPGHPTRRGEVESVREALERLGVDVVGDMRGTTAYCDGGDVMFTGRHLFVGVSNRTNADAVEALRRAFGGDVEDVVAVPPVVQGGDVLHLKSAVTHIDETTLLVPAGRMGDDLLDAMQATTKLGYEAIRIPDVLACNAVAANGHVLAQDSKCEESRRLLLEATREHNLGISFVDTSELAKKDAALTCCSVLL